MKTKSPVSNGGILNPKRGVESVHVAIPRALVVIELIPTPLELLIATILCGSESNPNNGPSCSTLETAPFGALATKDVESYTDCFVSFHKIKSGSLKYLAPPYSISILSIVSRLSTLTIGGTKASGLKVLSEE